MANRLVPYIQDTDKWTQHFIKQAMKQTHPERNDEKCFE